MYLYDDQFSANHDFPRVNKPSKVLIIASTPRCGSHMFGHILHQTNSLGFPLEYANQANVNEWKKRLKKTNFSEALEEIMKRRTSTNGVFSLKVHYTHLQKFGGFDGLLQKFPNAYIVFITRRSVLKQAVSLSIASKTGVWISGQKPKKLNPEYDFNHIHRCLRKTVLDNASWRYLLAASGCNYIEMNFEDVQKNLEQSVKTVASFMNVEINTDLIPKKPVTKKQSNPLNSQWSQRFIEEFDTSKKLV